YKDGDLVVMTVGHDDEAENAADVGTADEPADSDDSSASSEQSSDADANEPEAVADDSNIDAEEPEMVTVKGDITDDEARDAALEVLYEDNDSASTPDSVPAVSGSVADGQASGENAPGFVSALTDVPLRKKHNPAKVAGITIGTLVGVVGAAYLGGALAFSNWFLPGTTIGGTDVSMKSSQEVAELIDKTVASYNVNVAGGGFTYHTDAEALKLKAESDAIVKAMHEDLDMWKWPVLLYEGQHDESSRFDISYDFGAVKEDLSKAIATYNEGATPSANASVAYNEAEEKFVVIPEVVGSQLREDAVFEQVENAVKNLLPTVSLSSKDMIQPSLLSTDPKLQKAADAATGLVTTRMDLKMDGHDVGSVGPDQLKQWVSIGDDYEVTFNEESMSEWISELSESFDTVGTTRTYTRPDGKEITIGGGSYGWSIDSEALRDMLIEGVMSHTVGDVEIPCDMIGQTYQGPGLRDWSNRYLDVDIEEQHVYFYGDDGEIIWESDCITGSPDGKHNTVPGVWYLNAKESPSTLIGYKDNGEKDYETVVRWWMPFEGNAIGFHDADWQPAFGGAMYAQGYGSHGCVNLPVSAAEELYSLIEPNDVVVVH
ncbi:MAG: L,D-transpeptidase family protein, partial [Eggerthellaceae bacterium]|nr:L,D-transpeptidase family protein [Eggerthellaceae bacterium]